MVGLNHIILAICVRHEPKSGFEKPVCVELAAIDQISIKFLSSELSKLLWEKFRKGLELNEQETWLEKYKSELEKHPNKDLLMSSTKERNLTHLYGGTFSTPEEEE